MPGRTREEIGNPRLHELNEEEAFAVWNWLFKHGYTDEYSKPDDPNPVENSQ